jgi:polyhydroxyalkanoate synthesis regulator phasin
MTIDRDLIDRLRARGEEMFTQVSAELMQNPNFVKAMQGALKGKERVEDAVRQALKKADIPSRTEHKRAVSRIEALEAEVAELRKKVAAKASPAPRAAKKASKTRARPGGARASTRGGKGPRKAS